MVLYRVRESYKPSMEAGRQQVGNMHSGNTEKEFCPMFRSVSHILVHNKQICLKIPWSATKKLRGLVKGNLIYTQTMLSRKASYTSDKLPMKKWAPWKPCAGWLKTISISCPQGQHSLQIRSGCLSNKFLGCSLKFLGKYKHQSQINAFKSKAVEHVPCQWDPHISPK